MFFGRLQVIYCIYLMLLEISFLHAQKGTSTSFDEGDVPNLVKPRFFDPANMGFTNFAPGRFGNLGSNYPTDSPFSPLGNEFPNVQSKPDYEWGQKEYPNKGNFQGSQGGLDQSHGILPNHRGLIQPGLNGILDPNTPDVNTNQNELWNSVPDDVSLLYVDKPQQSGGSNFQPGQSNGEALQFPEPNGQNPIQDSYFVPHSNYQQNTRPQFSNRPINYPIENNQYSGDNGIYRNQQQYPLQNNFPEPRNPNLPKPQLPYTSDFSNLQNTQTNQGRLNGNRPVHSLNQIPISRGMGNNNGFNINEANLNHAPRYIPKIADQYQHVESDDADSKRKVAILRKPVIIPPETTEPRDVDDESSKKAVQKQCVQDCDTTSEYNPICGTNNVTYINAEKFACARNCGVDVTISRYGRCNDDPASNYARR